MKPAIPLTKASELLTKFCELVKSTRPIDAFTLRRMEAEAQAEIKHDPDTAYMLLGAIAATRWDVAGLRRNHMAAIRLSDDETTRTNYAVSLEHVGMLQDAAKEAEAAFRLAPTDLVILELAIKYHWMAGMLGSLRTLLLDFEKRTKVKHPCEAHAQELELVFERTGTEQSEYAKSIEIAFDVLRKAKLRISQTAVDIDLDEGDESVLYSLEIRSTDEQIEPWRSMLAQRLCDELGDRWRPEVLMFELKASA